MFKFTLLSFALLFVLTSAERHEKQVDKVKETETEKPIIRIVSFRNEQNIDGSYRFEYESEDGSKRFEQGYYKDTDKTEDGKAQVVEGSYSYLDPQGEIVDIKYVADEHGFRPQGNIIHPAISSYIQNLNLESNDNENEPQESVRKA